MVGMFPAAAWCCVTFVVRAILAWECKSVPKMTASKRQPSNLDCYGLFRTPVPKPAHCELPRSAFAVYQANPVPGEMSGEAFMFTCVGLRTAVGPSRCHDPARNSLAGNRYFFLRLP